MRTNVTAIHIIACFVLSSGASLAEKKFTAVPIEIRSDSMQLDINSGSSEYRGNVHIQKGAITLQGELVLINRQNNTVDNIVINGTPARYQQQTEQGKTHAQSESMLFDVAKNILTMKTNARLFHDAQLIESNYIQFDTDKQVLLAGAAPVTDSTAKTGKQRVNITLTPGNTRNNKLVDQNTESDN